MADYCIGSTGVAQLHVNFASPKDLVQLPFHPVEKVSRKATPRKRKLHSEQRYLHFEEFMNQKLRGRTKISGSEMEMILAHASQSLSMKVGSIRNTLLKRYYQEHDVTVMPGYNIERSKRYLKQYKRFKEVRDKYPEISIAKRQELYDQLATELNISVKTISGARYELKWRREHEAD